MTSSLVRGIQASPDKRPFYGVKLAKERPVNTADVRTLLSSVAIDLDFHDPGLIHSGRLFKLNGYVLTAVT